MTASSSSPNCVASSSATGSSKVVTPAKMTPTPTSTPTSNDNENENENETPPAMNKASSSGDADGAADNATPPPPGDGSITVASETSSTRRLVFFEEGDDNNTISNTATNAPPPETKTYYYPMPEIRNQLLLLGELSGDLSKIFRTKVPLDPPHDRPQPSEALAASCYTSSELAVASSRLLSALLAAATLFGIDLRRAVHRKIDLNSRKYPIDLCQGKAGKYTEYSAATGITREIGQSTLPVKSDAGGGPDSNNDSLGSGSGSSGGSNNNNSSFADSIAELTETIRAFALERKWERYHTPRSLMLALLGELGELAELYQWREDCVRNDDEITPELLDKTGQELADVTIYLLRLAGVCGLAPTILEDYYV